MSKKHKSRMARKESTTENRKNKKYKKIIVMSKGKHFVQNNKEQIKNIIGDFSPAIEKAVVQVLDTYFKEHGITGDVDKELKESIFNYIRKKLEAITVLSKNENVKKTGMAYVMRLYGQHRRAS